MYLFDYVEGQLYFFSLRKQATTGVEEVENRLQLYVYSLRQQATT